MKRWLLISICGIGLVHEAHSQLAVLDIGTEINTLNTALNSAKTYIQGQLAWATQLKQLATETASYLTEAQTLWSLVHNPSIGAALGILSQAGLDTSLPYTGYSAMSVVNGFKSFGAGGFNLGAIQGVVGTLSTFGGVSYNANHIYTPTGNMWSGQEMNTRAGQIAGTQGAAAAAMQDFENHRAALGALRTQGLEASNALDQAATNTQVNIENAWGVNELGKLMAVQVASEAQTEANKQRDDEVLQRGTDHMLDALKQAGTPGL